MVTFSVAMLSAFISIFAIAILIDVWRKENRTTFASYIFIGVLVALFDFMVEYLGTDINDWVYNASHYFIFGQVPIELSIMFFSGGIILRYAYVLSTKFNMPVRLNTIFYLLIIFGFLVYTRALYLLKIPSNLLYVAVPAGLWALHNIKSEGNKVSAVVFATVVGLLDAIFELLIIRDGGYSYASGFSWDIPIIYFLLTLVLLGIMERADVLDSFFSNSIVKAILRLAGIKRIKYEKKFKKIVKQVRKKRR